MGEWKDGRNTYANVGDEAIASGAPTPLLIRFHQTYSSKKWKPCACCGEDTMGRLTYTIPNAKHGAVTWPICKRCQGEIELKYQFFTRKAVTKASEND